MTDRELLAELVDDFAAGIRDEIGALSPDELAWQPDPDANSIGVTVWHCARWLDLLKVRILENRATEEEQWHTQGWTAKTGYDPRGIGAAGLGAITGYSLEEAARVPKLSAQELLDYLDQSCSALSAHILARSSDSLYERAPIFNGKRTNYGWIKDLLEGCFGHLGEIAALKAMQSRGAYYPQTERANIA